MCWGDKGVKSLQLHTAQNLSPLARAIARRACRQPSLQCGRNDNDNDNDALLMMMKRAVFAALWVLDVRVLADSLYTVLGLTHSATAPEIKKAYYKLAQKLHPDKVRPEEKESAAVRFKMVAEAHATLSSPERRRLYDREQLGGSLQWSSRGASGQRTTSRGLITVPGVEELRRVCTGGRDNQLHRYMILALYDTRRPEPRQRRPRCAHPLVVRPLINRCHPAAQREVHEVVAGHGVSLSVHGLESGVARDLVGGVPGRSGP